MPPAVDEPESVAFDFQQNARRTGELIVHAKKLYVKEPTGWTHRESAILEPGRAETWERSEDAGQVGAVTAYAKRRQCRKCPMNLDNLTRQDDTAPGGGVQRRVEVEDYEPTGRTEHGAWSGAADGPEHDELKPTLGRHG